MTAGGKPDSIFKRLVQSKWEIIVVAVFTAGMTWRGLQMSASAEAARVERVEKQEAENSQRISDLEKLVIREDENSKHINDSITEINRKLDRILYYKNKDR